MQDLFPHIHHSEAVKLFKKAMSLYRRKEYFKAINRALRKSKRSGNDQALEELGFDRTQIANFKSPNNQGTIGIHPIVLRNLRTRIRKIRDKLIADFDLSIIDGKLTSSSPSTFPQTTHEMCGDVLIVDNVSKGRIQLFFPRKVRKPTTNVLKCYGFRWSQAVGAWQHPRDDRGTGLYWARRICRGWQHHVQHDSPAVAARFFLPES